MTGRIFAFAALAICLPVAARATEPPRVVLLCAGCHGLDGAGQDVTIPSIAGQSGIYLRTQLRAFRSGSRKHPQMSVNASALTDRDIDQIVTHYALMPAR